jgi:hypothetical protein
MKALRLLIFIPLLFACTPSTKVIATWKNPSAAKSYHSVFIATLTSNTVSRSSIETEIANAFSKKGIVSVKSIDEIPPTFKQDSTSKGILLEKIRSKGSDAILTVTLLRKATESRYVSGSYYPSSRYGYYSSFGGYYNYAYPNAYSPGYYESEDVYYLETNLYDSQTEMLIWSAQSKTESYGSLNSLAKEYATIIVDQMFAEKIIH